MYVHMGTCLLAYRHTHAHAHAQSYKHARTHARTHAHTQTQTQTHTHTHTHLVSCLWKMSMLRKNTFCAMNKHNIFSYDLTHGDIKSHIKQDPAL